MRPLLSCLHAYYPLSLPCECSVVGRACKPRQFQTVIRAKRTEAVTQNPEKSTLTSALGLPQRLPDPDTVDGALP
jgi:hypothetical protein